MTESELDAILAQRGYRRVPSPDPHLWRSWLWVEPIRENPISTKLCQWWTNGLDEAGLHWLLDHYCELRSPEYTDEQRARNANRMSIKSK